MSEYLQRSDGPGSIGALRPLASLSHSPTIGSNDPIRNIGPINGGPRRIPSLGGCSGCMGTDANGTTGLPSWAPYAAVAAVIGGWWWMKKKEEGAFLY